MGIWGKSIQAEGPAHGAPCVPRWECEAHAERARRPAWERKAGSSWVTALAGPGHAGLAAQ